MRLQRCRLIWVIFCWFEGGALFCKLWFDFSVFRSVPQTYRATCFAQSVDASAARNNLTRMFSDFEVVIGSSEADTASQHN